jgi:hypothetical protein
VDLDQNLDVDPHLELDGDVDVDPSVDLDLDRAPRFLDDDCATMTARSTCKVNEGVDVYVAVKGQSIGSTSTPRSTSSERVAGL